MDANRLRLLPDQSMGDGVYYGADQYVGFGRRFAIFLIDGIVLFAALVAASTAWIFAFDVEHFGMLCLADAVLAWAYLVPLKRSRLRTLGYRLTRARLVTLRGERPSLFMLSFRELFWVLGPGMLVNDFIWCGIDTDRQALRDRFSGICVVRSSAEPEGPGRIHLAYYFSMGYNLRFPWVVHPTSRG